MFALVRTTTITTPGNKVQSRQEQTLGMYPTNAAAKDELLQWWDLTATNLEAFGYKVKKTSCPFFQNRRLLEYSAVYPEEVTICFKIQPTNGWQGI